MTAPELVPKEAGGEARHEDTKRPDQERRGHPATRRRVKRWELGVFIRKIVNGWLAYYKQFPPGGGHDGRALQVQGESSSQADASSGETSLVSGPVQPYSGHGVGSGDSGPVGETSLESGVFLRSTTDTTNDEESDAA